MDGRKETSDTCVSYKLVSKRTSIGNSCSENDIGARSSKFSGEWPLYNANECYKVIVRMAQGQTIDADERTKLLVSVEFYARTNPSMAKALAQQLTGVHNLQSSFKRLFQSASTTTTASANTFEYKVGGAWSKFYRQILPNLQSVLYPFEEYIIQTRPSIRTQLLSAFRDQLLGDDSCCNALRSELAAKSEAVQTMLLVLEQATRDNSPAYWKLRKLCEDSINDLGIWETPSRYDDPRFPRRKLAVVANEIMPARVTMLKQSN